MHIHLHTHTRTHTHTHAQTHYQDVYTDETLRAHEEHLVACKERLETMQPILKMFDRRALITTSFTTSFTSILALFSGKERLETMQRFLKMFDRRAIKNSYTSSSRPLQ